MIISAYPAQERFDLIHHLKVFLSFILSVAILSVGSAATFASVHTRCLTPESDMIPMRNLDKQDKFSTVYMDCMKIKKKQLSHDPSCAAEQDCIMYHVQLVYPHSATPHFQHELLIEGSSQAFAPPALLLSSAQLPDVWRPPSTL